ncbi:hypothetical protein N3K66_005542 [Trichothecium roseum]|uniref:Uncharacterized protein n=1 Tax=Trichothecium roseum TaxID=47278 RepID=A0ACC0UYM7_9HYPO|nr:hypothetical protein N3K66_005542 [Trichothecium roseum]
MHKREKREVVNRSENTERNHTLPDSHALFHQVQGVTRVTDAQPAVLELLQGTRPASHYAHPDDFSKTVNRLLE